MTIDGQKAVIACDPEIEMFRGEFIGLSGEADFHAADVASLRIEGPACRVAPARQRLRP